MLCVVAPLVLEVGSKALLNVASLLMETCLTAFSGKIHIEEEEMRGNLKLLSPYAPTAVC